jgi:hypothetical protein
VGCKEVWDGEEHQWADLTAPGIKPEWMQDIEYSETCRIKVCPACRIWFEHKDACNHMKCYHCGHEFCFVCILPWEGFHTQAGCPAYGDPPGGYDDEGFEVGDRGLHRDTGYNRDGHNRLTLTPQNLTTDGDGIGDQPNIEDLMDVEEEVLVDIEEEEHTGPDPVETDDEEEFTTYSQLFGIDDDVDSVASWETEEDNRSEFDYEGYGATSPFGCTCHACIDLERDYWDVIDHAAETHEADLEKGAHVLASLIEITQEMNVVAPGQLQQWSSEDDIDEATTPVTLQLYIGCSAIR